jgi:putative SOS response-associated peptidase YedK
MCGRFTLTVDTAGLQQAFPQFTPPPGPKMPPRYNIAPTQPIAVVPNKGKNQVELMVWGLIPSWAKDPKIGNQMINARGETIAEKPAFRSAYKRRRCLIFADGFYEWRKEGKIKIPTYIRLRDDDGVVGAPFAMAGLWETWNDIATCTIITTEANEFMKTMHDRMPVILPSDCYEEWLDPAERPAEKLQHLIAQYPAKYFVSHAVSTAVNNAKHDAPDCIASVSDAA